MVEQLLHIEKELFIRIADGDEMAFEKLFHLYVPEIRPVIIAVIQSEAYLKDIVQEIFLDLWLGRDKLALIEQPRNWIFRLTYNRCYGWLEKQAVREKAKQKIADESAGTENLIVEGLAFRETAALIQMAIQQLPAQAKHIYTLSRTNGLKVSEIAQQLNIAPQSVKNSLYRSGLFIKDFLAAKGIVIPLFLLLSVFFPES